jgi:pimeloyl-ACP methyl ester carboxylesterase
MQPELAARQDAPILGHTIYGQGDEKVLVLHDWMGDSANYDPLLPYLDPAAYRYVFADARGYGRSRQFTGTYSADEMAADAWGLADDRGSALTPPMRARTWRLSRRPPSKMLRPTPSADAGSARAAGR